MTCEITDISQETGITEDEVYYVLKSENMISTGYGTPSTLYSSQRFGSPATPFTPGSAKFASRPLVTKKRRYPHYPEAELKVPKPGTYEIVFDHEHVKAFIAKSDAKDYLRLKPENLRWTPLFIDAEEAQMDEEGCTARIRTTGDRTEPPERVPLQQMPPPPEHLPTMMGSVDPSLVDPDLRALPASVSKPASILNKRDPAADFQRSRQPQPLVLPSTPKYQHNEFSLQQQKAMGANGTTAAVHVNGHGMGTRRPRIPDSSSDEEVIDERPKKRARNSIAVDSSPDQGRGPRPGASSEDASDPTEADVDGEAEIDAEGEEDEGFEAVETTW